MALVSPTQRKALEALAEGGNISVVRNTGTAAKKRYAASLWRFPGMVRESISMSTVEALRVQGWLEDMGDPRTAWRGTQYSISSKGLAQLEVERNRDKLTGEGAKQLRRFRRSGVRIKW